LNAVAVGPAREVAAAVLFRVFTEDAFASAALDAELKRRPQLDPRDVGLATELVYGVLRTEAMLDERIAALAARRGYASDPLVFAHLLMGAYQICFLDRVPVFAVVSEAVAGVSERAGERVGGFANAVLRKLAVEIEARGRPSLEETIAASAPGWLRGSLRRAIGRAAASAYLTAGPVPPPIGLCLAEGEDRDALITELRAAAPHATIEPGGVSPRAILVRGAGDVRRLPGVGERWIVQEEGAQVVALAAGAKAGEQVLDACSGHGNKSWLLAQQVAPSGAVDASDLHPAKLDKLLAGPPGKRIRSTFAIDWTVGAGDVPEGYDRVIVDAPCSGTGTLRRRPEIGRKRDAEDLAGLADLQTAITRQAATRVRDGGTLLYAVCSVLKEEAEEVVTRLVEGSVGEAVTLTPLPFESEMLRALAPGEHTLRLLPHVHGTDGYFVASLRVTKRG
jgi:16S rRNA (cytosine967-C5)-methyltransferase